MVQKIVRTEVSADPGFKVLKAILRNLTAVAEAKKVAKPSTGGGSVEGPTSPSAEPSGDPAAALLEKIRGNLAKFETNPPAIDDDKLGRLLARVAEYLEQGGTEDVSDVERRVRGELGARKVVTEAWGDVNGVRERLRALAGDLFAMRSKYAGDPGAVVSELQPIVERLSGYRDAIERALHG
jgi:hypothetical protein